MDVSNKKIHAFIDGACTPQDPDTPGGWGVFLSVKDVKERSVGGFVLNTTNNRMELTSFIKALELVKDLPGWTMTVHTDSQVLWYAIHNRQTWEATNFKNKVNVDLIKRIYELMDSFVHMKITLAKVKGHSDNEGNIKADKLAVEAKTTRQSIDRTVFF